MSPSHVTMPLLDILLIHPPSIHDFRERAVHYGPISDVIPSYPIFDMYPIGYISILSYLTRHGYRCGLLNLASLMLMRRNLRVEALLEKARVRIFGLDLHWLVSAQGAVEVARILKRLHPDTPIVTGGLSATYYHREIMGTHPEIDFLVRGDTSERSLLKLVQHVVDRRGGLEEIPNLVWRDGSRIRINPQELAPANLDEFQVDYGVVFRRAASSLDPLGFLPYADFPKAPAAGILLYKGCPMNCLACGGSRYAYAHACGRACLGVKSPETILAEIASVLEYLRIPIFLVGDPQFLGRRWLEAFVGAARTSHIDASLYAEFFLPPPRACLGALLRLGEGDLSLQISPDSHEERIRRAYGRPYDNRTLERFVDTVDASSARKLDVYFMTGLPGQTLSSARESALCADALMRRSSKVDAFMSPLAPFVDPGSVAFERAASQGYHLFAKTFEEHRRLMDRATNWKEMLNYETAWMTRDDIVRSTYESSRLLLQVKARRHLISETQLRETLDKIDAAEAEMRGSGWVSKWEIVPSATLYPTTQLLRSFTLRASLGLLRAFKEERGLRRAQRRKGALAFSS